ncbi:MAG: Fe-S cluster assembly protein SufD [Thiotrichales bacterium]
MSTPVDSLQRLTGWAAAAVAAGDAPDWLRAARGEALADAEALPLPNQKSEAWRYTSIEPLLRQAFQPVTQTPEVALGEANGYALLGEDSLRVVLVNGRFAPELSRLAAVPDGVTLGSLKSLSEAGVPIARAVLTKTKTDAGNVFTSLNRAGWQDGLLLHLRAGVLLGQPLEVLHLSLGGDAPHVAQSRHTIELEAGAHASIVERYVAMDEGSYCNNSMLEIALGEGASLVHTRLQEESAQGFHIAGIDLRQHANSEYRAVHFAAGAQWSRTDINVAFLGPDADCDLNGVYLTGDKQLTDYHINVTHDVPGCTSKERFRGIVYGRGRAVFDGRIFVQKDAQKTDAQLSNDNLLLSRNGEVDTKPWLEILADDVKCSHGTTVGQLDEQMVFYLRSRGIPEPEARQLLCLGFAGEVLDALEFPALREHAEDIVRTRLSQVVGDTATA